MIYSDDLEADTVYNNFSAAAYISIKVTNPENLYVLAKTTYTHVCIVSKIKLANYQCLPLGNHLQTGVPINALC